jgi:alkylation response protein AidB-like acyl-CoA dehydrogenase
MNAMTNSPTALVKEREANTAVATDAADDYVARAVALQPLIIAAAPRIQEDRELPDDLLDALHDAGMYRLMLPRSVGGAELDLPQFVQVLEALGMADASTAWCLGQQAGCAMSAAYMDPAGAKEIFGGPNAAMAWGPPAGKTEAVEVEGGFKVTGTWQFASGSRHVTWMGAKGPVFDAKGNMKTEKDGKTPVLRTMAFPRSSAKITDTWQVIGLKGTGSDRYEVKDLFVPMAHTFAMDDARERREQGAMYQFLSVPVHGYGFCGIALGVARSALEAFLELAGKKQPKHWNSKLRESSLIQYQVATAEAQLRGARAFLMEGLHNSWETVSKTGTQPVDQRVALRLATTHGMHQAKEVVDFAYYNAGATAIFNSNPFERPFRDIHTICQQGQAAPINMEAVGQILLGLDVNTSRPI